MAVIKVLPRGVAHFVSLLPPPHRGQHQRPGEARSAVLLALMATAARPTATFGAKR